MSTDLGEDLLGIGPRLRTERDRLGLSQESLGTRLSTTGRTIKKYEANETSIRATELLQMSALGADVLYIVTGQRLPLSAAESRRPCTPAERAAMVIGDLKLSEADAQLVVSIAQHLAQRDPVR